jgi:hypothetical protein
MVTIEGLNERQRFLADIIWACEHKDNVDAFIRSLPTKELRNEAQSIVDLMIMAVVEQCYDGVSEMTEATKLIRKVAK